MRIDIELLRIISVFGIVWFHSAVPFGREASYGGLIFLIIIAAYFTTVSDRSNKPVDRFKRLIIPCLIWSVFYGLLNLIAKGQICPEDYGLLSCILSTPSTHLWYLPYIYFVSVLIEQGKKILSRQDMGTLCSVMATALLLFAPTWIAFTLASPWDLYLHALPAALSGVFLGCYNSMGKNFRLFILSGFITSITITVFTLPDAVGIPYLSGTLPGLLLLTSDVLKKYQPNIYPLSSLMYGVYLIHFAFILIFLSLGLDNYFLPFVAFGLSVLVIYAIKKILPENIYKYLL